MQRKNPSASLSKEMLIRMLSVSRVFALSITEAIVSGFTAILKAANACIDAHYW